MGVPYRSEGEGPLEAGVSPERSAVPQGSRGFLGRQGVPRFQRVWGVALTEMRSLGEVRSLGKVEGPSEKGTSLRKGEGLPERRGPSEK